jgi:hypothetical protein
MPYYHADLLANLARKPSERVPRVPQLGHANGVEIAPAHAQLLTDYPSEEFPTQAN